ncbi:MAG: penicillin-binding protein 2 [Dialister pneumosintes]|uniref:Penicillin-binding protein 2 n=2 Tax=Dialister pneumosintes TaxID=39950 RepID=A0A1B3WDK7_9FIRM|nr:penicillin-binding protein 2 [Dialister pneumosintes]
MVKRNKIPGFLSNLIKKEEESRYANMLYIAVIFLCLLSLRIFYMQILKGSYYKSESDGNRMRQIPVQAARGVMYDRNGKIMAGSRSAYSIILSDVNKDKDIPEIELNRLASLLNISASEIKEKISKNKKSFGEIVIARDVGIDVATQIEERRDEYPNFNIEVYPLRVYPLNDAGGQILGYVGEAGEEDRDSNGNTYQLGTIIGRAGLEAQFNEYLEGTNGTKLVEVDASGHPVKILNGIPVTRGHNIRLTLDSRVQKAAEDAIKEQMITLGSSGSFATGASAVAMDPQTGAILAMVSWPSYDSNHFSQGISAKEWNSLITNPNHPMQNRTISSMYPPGSTFKVITGAAALEAHVMTPSEQIYDSGKHWVIDKRNAQGEAFGWIDFYQAMAKSDNVYFYEMGRRLGIDRLAAMSRAFGLGKKTGIDLPGETEGNVASEEYKREVFNQDWYLGETFDAAIGQSYTLVTPLQMAVVYSAIANGGYRYRPYLVTRIDNFDGTPLKIYSPEVMGTVPISKTTLETIQASILGVMKKEGTGGFLFADYPIPIAGKSGTAETNGIDNGWFIAYAPYDKPEIVVVVMFEHSGFGADSAAPVVKKMMDAYFHLDGNNKIN